jgi:hypothetical protein
MKSWIGTDGVLPDVEKRRRGTRTRFFTAALATSLILLGLKSSLPALKHQLLPWFVTLPAASVPTSSDKPYDWDNVSRSQYLLHNAHGSLSAQDEIHPVHTEGPVLSEAYSISMQSRSFWKDI